MNPFAVLGVPHDADDAALKRAYFKKVREHPPETDPEKFQAVQEAFDTLRDPVRRREALKPPLDPRLEALMREARGRPDVASVGRVLAEFPNHVPAKLLFVVLTARADEAQGLIGARALVAMHPAELEPLLFLASLEKGEARLEAYAKARALAPEDRRALYGTAHELIAQKRFDEAEAALGALNDAHDDELAAAQLLLRMERGKALDLSSCDQPPVLSALAAKMISTNRNVYARALVDRVNALRGDRAPIPFGPARQLSLEQLHPKTREAVEQNGYSPSRQTVRIRTPAAPTKKWVAKPPWWVELRRLHLVIRHASGVRVCPILSLHLQQREADVPLMLCDGADAGLAGLPELAVLFDFAMQQKRRLLELLSRDLLETEQQLEPLTWTPSSNA